MFKSILVPVDVAQRSSWQYALPQAIELASPHNGKISVLTVIRDRDALFEGVYFPFQLERMMADGHAKLSSIISEGPAQSIGIELEVRVGSICREILSVAREKAADLILMASHRPEFRDCLIGPNASYVVQHASCSVLVLRRFS